jgi:threonyl-tRNA synthetase
VVGGREEAEETVSLRQRRGEQQGGLKIEDVIERIEREVTEKSS